MAKHLNSHCPEHITYPADKRLPKEVVNNRAVSELTSEQKRLAKKAHNKRSRRYNNQEQADE